MTRLTTQKVHLTAEGNNFIIRKLSVEIVPKVPGVLMKSKVENELFDALRKCGIDAAKIHIH